MEIDRVTEVVAKCFSKSYGAEVHAALGVLDFDPTSNTKTYIFFMENPTYKELFFGCPDQERKCVLLTLMSKPKNYKVWDLLANFRFALFCYFVLFWPDSL